MSDEQSHAGQAGAGMNVKQEFLSAVGKVEDLVRQHLSGFLQLAALSALEAVKHLVEAHVSVSAHKG